MQVLQAVAPAIQFALWLSSVVFPAGQAVHMVAPCWASLYLPAAH